MGQTGSISGYNTKGPRLLYIYRTNLETWESLLIRKSHKGPQLGRCAGNRTEDDLVQRGDVWQELQLKKDLL
jgi:hypothetical protein